MYTVAPLPEEPIAEGAALGEEVTTVVAAASLAASDPLLNPFEGLEDTSVKAKEINAIRELTADNLATTVAIQNGDFSNPATFGGTLPGNGARVVIPEGVTVTYDLEGDVPRLDTLRVDGTLQFATNQDTDLIVDLFVVEDGGTLRIGTAANPIQSNVNARVTFASASNNTAIDLVRDPLQVSRGLVALPGSTTDIHGTNRTDFLTLADGGAGAGDTVLRFDSIPADFRVGDHLVLTGTSYNSNGSNDDNSRFRDEELTITGINRQNNTITFEQRDVGGNSLRFDHVTPEGFDLDIHVANLTRNVTFASAEGEDTPIQERGYTLFLDQDLRLFNAGFDYLGRFNNDIIVDNPVLNADGSLQPGTGTNRNGRIPVYVADTLVTGSYSDAAAVISGNAVNGTASWAFAAATSRVTFEDNVSFDAVGAHYVTRDGDEIAIFRDNIAIKATGAQTDRAANLLVLDDVMDEDNPNLRGPRRDVGVRGFGFWFDASYSAREVTGNIVASTEDAGFIWYGENDSERSPDSPNNGNAAGLVDVPVSSLPPDLRFRINGEVDSLDDFVPAWQVPNQTPDAWSGNTSYNGDSGLEIRGFRRNDDGGEVFLGNDRVGDPNLRGVFQDFTIWGVRDFGIQVDYSSLVQIEDSLIVGDIDDPIERRGNTNVAFSGAGSGSDGVTGHGIFFVRSTRGNVLVNNNIQGFEVGTLLSQTNGQSVELSDETQETTLGPSQLIGGTFANNTFNLGAAAGRAEDTNETDNIITNFAPFSPFFEISGNFDFEIPEGNVAPVASFTVSPVGNGLTVNFDASESVDPDYPAVNVGGNDNSIASYAWDFDSNGTIDDFGFQVEFTYNTPGTHNATLLVYDRQGATDTQTVAVTVPFDGNNDPSEPPTPPNPTTSGLNYSLFEGRFEVLPNFNTLTPIATGTTDSISPDVSTLDDEFAIQFEGFIEVPTTGTYTFHVNSDDGSRLLIDNSLIVNNDGVHAPINPVQGSVNLTAGLHPIVIEYFDRDRGEFLEVEFSGPGLARQTLSGEFLSSESTTDPQPPTNPNPGEPTNPGLRFSAFEGVFNSVPDFDALTPAAEGTTNSFTTDVRTQDDHFALQFEGFIEIPTAGEYTFYTESDDGSQLFIGDQLVVDNDGLHGRRTVGGTIALAAGFHPIEVGYFEGQGGEFLEVEFAGPGLQRQIIPSEFLSSEATTDPQPPTNPNPGEPTNPGLRFSAFEGIFSAQPDFDALTPVAQGTTNSFTTGVRTRDDHFALQFEGFIEIPTAGEYTFYTESDDGSQLFIGDQLVVDNGGLHGRRTVGGTIALAAGFHPIVVEYFEATNGEFLEVEFAGPGLQRQIISDSFLFF